LDARMHGCLDARMHGCLHARMHGCLDARMLGCTDAWMHGCLDARMHHRSSKKTTTAPEAKASMKSDTLALDLRAIGARCCPWAPPARCARARIAVCLRKRSMQGSDRAGVRFNAVSRMSETDGTPPFPVLHETLTTRLGALGTRCSGERDRLHGAPNTYRKQTSRPLRRDWVRQPNRPATDYGGGRPVLGKVERIGERCRRVHFSAWYGYCNAPPHRCSALLHSEGAVESVGSPG